jgi:hypothetical protein
VKGTGRESARVWISVRVVFWLLGLYATVAAVHGLIERVPAPDPHRAKVRLDQFLPVREVLGSVERVGLVTEAGPEVSQLETAAESLLAQYALAPVVIVPNPPGGIFVGSFREPSIARRVCERLGLRVERDFGNGLYLLRRIE